MSPEGDKVVIVSGRKVGDRVFQSIAVVDTDKPDRIVFTAPPGAVKGYVHYSADGQHLGYLCEKDGKLYVSIDHRIVSPAFRGAVTRLHIGADGRFAVGIRNDPSNPEEGSFLLTEKGKHGPYDSINIAGFDETGKHLVYFTFESDHKRYLARVENKAYGPYRHLLDWEGQRIYAYDAKSERFAVAFATESRRFHVEVDGKRSPAFDGVFSEIVFSNDGARLAYVGMRDSSWFISLEGKELGPFQAVRSLRFSPKESRLACVVVVGAGESVAIDGIPGKVYDQIVSRPDFLQAGTLRYLAVRENVLYEVTETLDARNSATPD
jgi:hypothetical protein